MKKYDIQNNKIKYGFIILLNIIFFIISVTVIINYVIAKESLITVADESDWIGYYGSILSGLISGGITFLGVLFTIKYYKMQHDNIKKIEEDREKLKIRPYIILKKNNPEFSVHKDNKVQFVKEQKSGDPYISMQYRFIMENVGNGPAIGITFEKIVGQKKHEEHKKYYLRPNETVECLLKCDSLGINYEYEFVIIYSDVEDNKYRQKINFDGNHLIGSLSLKEINRPELLNT